MKRKGKKPNFWLFALRILERFRISQGHDVLWLWNHLNRRGMKKMSVREFGETLNEIMPEISIECGTILGKKIARVNKTPDHVNYDGLVKILGSTPNINSIEALLSDHPIFPQWLVSRNDFQQLFIELNSENGCPSNYLVECTCRTASESRSIGDLSIVAKWLKINKILESVKTNHLIDCAKNLNLLEVPAKVSVVTQGDPGDAFYVVLEGTLDVIIDNTIVNKMVSGTAFGEKALENDAPRSASVRTIGECKLLVLLASDYKHLVSNAQQRRLYELADFLFKTSICFQHFSFHRIVSIVSLGTRHRFKKGQKCLIQNDPATGLMFILSGKVRCRKNISIKTLIDHRIIRKRDSFMFLGDGLPGESRRKSQMSGRNNSNNIHDSNNDNSNSGNNSGYIGHARHPSTNQLDHTESHDALKNAHKRTSKRFSVSSRLSIQVSRDSFPGRSRQHSQRRSIANPEFSSAFRQKMKGSQSYIFKSVITDEEGGVEDVPDKETIGDALIGEVEEDDEVKEVSVVGGIVKPLLSTSTYTSNSSSDNRKSNNNSNHEGRNITHLSPIVANTPPIDSTSGTGIGISRNGQRHASMIALRYNKKSDLNPQMNDTTKDLSTNSTAKSPSVIVSEDKDTAIDTSGNVNESNTKNNSKGNGNPSIKFTSIKQNSIDADRGRSVCVPMSDVGPGSVIGDDTVRVRSFNTYEAIALEPTEVLVVNVQEALQYWRVNALETLLLETAILHRSDIELVLEHEKETKKQLAKKRIRRAVIPATYGRHMGLKANNQQSPPTIPASDSNLFKRTRSINPSTSVGGDRKQVTRRSSEFVSGMRLPPPQVSPIKVGNRKALSTPSSVPPLSSIQHSSSSTPVSTTTHIPLSLPPPAPVPSDALE